MSSLSRYHIKLFMVSEYESGYICSFSIYAGKGPGNLLKEHVTLDPDYSRATKAVIGLLYVTHWEIQVFLRFFQVNWCHLGIRSI